VNATPAGFIYKKSPHVTLGSTPTTSCPRKRRFTTSRGKTKAIARGWAVHGGNGQSYEPISRRNFGAPATEDKELGNFEDLIFAHPALA
jgi:hypothetical protein